MESNHYISRLTIHYKNEYLYPIFNVIKYHMASHVLLCSMDGTFDISDISTSTRMTMLLCWGKLWPLKVCQLGQKIGLMCVI